MGNSTGSEYRRSAAYAFAEALDNCGLNQEQARHRLALMVGRGTPIHRVTMADYRTGVTAVPLELVLAACRLADMSFSIAPDGTVQISRQPPSAEELRARTRRPALRAAGGGNRINMKLMPGGLAVCALLLALVWSLQVGWPTTLRVVDSARHAINDPPAVFPLLPASVSAQPSPQAAASVSGSGPRALASVSPRPSASISPGRSAAQAASSSSVAVSAALPGPSPSQAPSVTPTSIPVPSTPTGGATSTVVDLLPTPAPTPAPTPTPSAAPLPVPSGASLSVP